MNKDDYDIVVLHVIFSIYDKDGNAVINEHGWERKFATIDADYDFQYVADNLTVDDLEEVF